MLAAGVLCTASAAAVTVAVPESRPSLVGQTATFSAVVTDAVGPVRLRWSMGELPPVDLVEGATQFEHTFEAPGHYWILVHAFDRAGSLVGGLSFQHTVYSPLTPVRAAGSSDLVYDQVARKLYSANYDNDTVTVVDAANMVKESEVTVSRGPTSLALGAEGKLWVLHRDAHSLAILDATSMSVESEIVLPYASQPMGLAISPTGNAAYVTLMALGKLLKLDAADGTILAEADVGSSARGVSVSHDGAQIYVTRFISGDGHGEVVRLNAATFSVETRFELAADTTTEDASQQGRGLPNYLFSIGLSPDGLWAWVPGKKDNVFRGPFRDGAALTGENTVRALIALLNVAEGREHVERRIDLDDRSLPNQVEFSPLGDYAFVSLAGSAAVSVRDAYTGELVTDLRAGFAPRGLVLTEDNKLFVHASASRSLVVYDVADIVSLSSKEGRRLLEIPTVVAEKLEPAVLRGQQIFFNSSDKRMSDHGHLSCASCHFDGADDGRVWDFGSAGEGLRNSISLLGRRGVGHGNVNWSGSFDEVQDADDNIRNLFGGKGFLSAEKLAMGTVAQPLGDKKAGLDADLDALASFVSSLDTYHASPYRNPNGTLTADGLAGRDIFRRLGCDICHTGADGTDSTRGKLHDVGTLKSTSGSRGSQLLPGIDTPTLNGVWETPPYLHDGSAATLRDVLTIANPEDRHGFTSELSPLELDQLVAYLQQVDGTPNPDGGSEGAAGSSSQPADKGTCTLARPAAGSFGAAPWLLVAFLLARRRKWRLRSPRATPRPRAAR
ncbi:MAG TPA: PKD domain-containing protein [Polyangiaceae bacterium]|nr:PKD domain-containing protein [Polyangiaceae bacterium]